MKIRLSLVLLLLTSCYQPEVEEINTEVENLRGETVASIEAQKSSVETSISKLESFTTEIKTYVESLQEISSTLTGGVSQVDDMLKSLEDSLSGNVSTITADISATLVTVRESIVLQAQSLDDATESLKSQDALLNSRIKDLRGFVDASLSGSKSWLTATFATLEKQNETAAQIDSVKTLITSISSDINGLRTRTDERLQALSSRLDGDLKQTVENLTTAYTDLIGNAVTGLNTKVETDVQDLENSVKTWVNEKLVAYSTSSESRARIAELKSLLRGELSENYVYLNRLDSNLNLVALANRQTISRNIDSLVLKDDDISRQMADIARDILSSTSDIDAVNLKVKDIFALVKHASDSLNRLVADNAAAIADNLSLIQQNQTAISANSDAIAANKAELGPLSASLDTLVSNLKSDYKNLIATSITTANGSITDGLAEQVAEVLKNHNSDVAVVNDSLKALKSRVLNLQSQIDLLKAAIDGGVGALKNRISSVEEQVDAMIKAIGSLSDLKVTLRQYIEALQSSLKDDDKSILASLNASETGLSSQMDKLATTAESLNLNLTDTKSWIESTFVTLDQEKELQDSLAALRGRISAIYGMLTDSDTSIDGRITELKGQLDKEISDLKTSMQGWVYGYFYDRTGIDDKFNEVEISLRALGASDAYIHSRIDSLGAVLDTNRSEITRTYKAAIKAAIEDNDGYVTTEIKTNILEANQKLATLRTDVDKLLSEVSDLKKRMGDVEANIQTINGQIESIKKSLTDLGNVDTALRAYIDSLKNAQGTVDSGMEKAISSAITALETEDKRLNTKIDSLRDYIGTLPQGATQTTVTDWISATLRTYALQTEFATSISGIETRIETLRQQVIANKSDIESRLAEIHSKLNASVDTARTNMKSWINSQFYDSGEIDGKISAINASIGSVPAGTSLQKEITDIVSSMKTVRDTVKNSYESAISSAISNLNGTLTTVLSDSLKSVNIYLEIMDGWASDLEKSFNALAVRVTDAEKQITDIGGQLEDIRRTISNLSSADSTIRAYIDTVNAHLQGADAHIRASLKAAVDTLEAKDVKLNEQREALEKYIGTVPASGDTTLAKWVEVTLASYASKTDLESTIASISSLEKVLTGAISKDSTGLAEKIAAVSRNMRQHLDTTSSNLKKLINSSVYTKGEIVGQISTLNGLIGTVPQGKTLQGQLTELNSTLTQLEGTLTKGYKDSLEKAINQYNGVIVPSLENKFKQDSVSLNTLSARIDMFRDSVDHLLARVATDSSSISLLEKQAASIDSTVKELKAIDTKLRAYIDSLHKANIDTLKSFASLVNILEQKDGSLQADIKSLESYIGKIPTGSSYNDVSAWIQGTFSSLSKQKETVSTIAGINSTIDAVKTSVRADSLQLAKALADTASAIQTAINNTAAGLRKWVNTSLDAYYTAGEIQGMLDTRKSILDSLKNNDTVMKDSLSKLSDILDKKAKEITKAYQEAISTAIAEEDGFITSAIHGRVNTIHTNISNLKTRTQTISDSLDKVTARVVKNELDITDLFRQLDSIGTNVIGSLGADDDAMKLVNALQQRINKLKDGGKTMKYVEDAVAALRTQIYQTDSIVKRIASLEARKAAIVTKDGELDGQLDALDSSLKTLISTSVSDLLAEADATRGSTLDSLLSRVTNMYQLTSIVEDLSVLIGKSSDKDIIRRIKDVSDMLSDACNRLLLISESVNTHSGEITEMQTQINGIEEKMVELTNLSIIRSINSITYVPTNTDKTAVIGDNDKVLFNFKIYPQSSVPFLDSLFKAKNNSQESCIKMVVRKIKDNSSSNGFYDDELVFNTNDVTISPSSSSISILASFPDAIKNYIAQNSTDPIVCSAALLISAPRSDNSLISGRSSDFIPIEHKVLTGDNIIFEDTDDNIFVWDKKQIKAKLKSSSSEIDNKFKWAIIGDNQAGAIINKDTGEIEGQGKTGNITIQASTGNVSATHVVRIVSPVSLPELNESVESGNSKTLTAQIDKNAMGYSVYKWVIDSQFIIEENKSGNDYSFKANYGESATGKASAPISVIVVKDNDTGKQYTSNKVDISVNLKNVITGLNKTSINLLNHIPFMLEAKLANDEFDITWGSSEYCSVESSGSNNRKGKIVGSVPDQNFGDESKVNGGKIIITATHRTKGNSCTYTFDNIRIFSLDKKQVKLSISGNNSSIFELWTSSKSGSLSGNIEDAKGIDFTLTDDMWGWTSDNSDVMLDPTTGPEVDVKIVGNSQINKLGYGVAYITVKLKYDEYTFGSYTMPKGNGIAYK